jgi:hypothetical protein
MGTAWDPESILAYDIETTGLKRGSDTITVVCLYGHNAAEGVVFNFLYEEKFEEQKAELLRRLDEAPRLTGFNSFRFDAPFLQSYFNIDAARVQQWILKTFDVWEVCKTLIGQTFKMELLLNVNRFTSKSGSGLQAVMWAKNPETWPLLESYCLDDARLTWLVGTAAVIILPVGRADPRNPIQLATPLHSIRKRVDGSFHILLED